MEMPTDGDPIEVLWMLEMVVVEGRRAGQVTERTVWWKAYVKDIKAVDSTSWTAIVFYEAGYGMEASKMEARFEQCSLRHDETELKHKWRRIKTLEPSSNLENHIDDKGSAYTWMDLDSADSVEHVPDGMRQPQVSSLSRRLSSLQMRFDELQRFVGAQTACYSGLVGSASESDFLADRVFAYLRQRIVLRSLKGVIFPRARHALSDLASENGQFVGFCYTSTLKAHADCSLSEYEHIARVIKKRLPQAVFQPSFVDTQPPRYELDTASVLFDSLHEIAHCIGLRGLPDLLSLVGKGRKISGTELAEDCALRLLGLLWQKEMMKITRLSSE